MMTRTILCLGSLAALLASPPRAESAATQGALQASITVTSSCVTQQPFASAFSQIGDVSVTCQPAVTPFIMQSINLGSAPASTAANDAQPDAQQSSQHGSNANGASGKKEGQAGGGVPFSVLSAKDVLAIPLPGQSTTASRLIYVKF